MELTPVFIFSLPRSGSTLLQRILAAHDRIDTCAEPWILLPVASARRSRLFADYGHIPAQKAISDFLNQIDSGEDAYFDALRAFGLSLYERSSGQRATHFVDKTPRYHLIVDQIMESFPNGKFIFLWRHPLSIVTSISNTWSDGRWNLGHYRVDLFDGIKNLVHASRQNGDKSIYILKYEEIIKNTKKTIQNVFEHIGVEQDPRVITKFSQVEPEGRFGDPTGVDKYNKVSQSPISKWKKSVNNKVRKVWCKKYIEWIGQDTLNYMGYNYEGILEEIDKIPSKNKYLLSDISCIIWDNLRAWLHPTLQKKYIQMYKCNEPLYDIH